MLKTLGRTVPDPLSEWIEERDEARRIAANIAKLPEMLKPLQLSVNG